MLRTKLLSSTVHHLPAAGSTSQNGCCVKLPSRSTRNASLVHRHRTRKSDATQRVPRKRVSKPPLPKSEYPADSIGIALAIPPTATIPSRSKLTNVVFSRVRPDHAGSSMPRRTLLTSPTSAASTASPSVLSVARPPENDHPLGPAEGKLTSDGDASHRGQFSTAWPTISALTILLAPHGPRSFELDDGPTSSPSAPVPSMPRMLLSATTASTRCNAATEPKAMPLWPLRHENWPRNAAPSGANGFSAETAAHGSADFG